MNFDKSEALVEKHVHGTAGFLVTEMLHHEEYECKLNEVLSKDDYITPASDAGYTVEDREDGFYLISVDGEDGSFLTAYDAWVEACSLEGIEPFIDEAHEHWIVSEMLAYQLEKRGELVTQFFGVTIWGRCGTGSAVYTDDVMVDIAANTLI